MTEIPTLDELRAAHRRRLERKLAIIDYTIFIIGVFSLLTLYYILNV